MSHAKKQLPYGNCKIFSPDNILLCRCSRERADWYTKRGLAEVIEETPHYSVRLNFNPKGYGHAGDEYYLTGKENRCVVCGTEENLTSHHCVPYCFRKWFPHELKRFSSHDVLVVCIPCHKKYEEKAWELKKKLLIEATGQDFSQAIEEQHESLKIIRLATALKKHGEKIPDERKAAIMERISNHLRRECTDEDLRKLVIEKGESGEFFGRPVVENTQDIPGFIKMWREHFVETSNPKYLPQHWDVNRR